MEYLISNNLEELEIINKKIHQYMIDTIPDYNASKWADIIEHPNEKLYALPIKTSDPRNPLNALSNEEKVKTLKSLNEGWFIINGNSKSFKKIPSNP